MPGPLLSFVEEGLAELEAMITPAERTRITGFGVAAPFELWSWAREVGAPQEDMDQWRGVDLEAEIVRRVPYPVMLQNDATSACAAELVFGLGPQYPDFLYLFIGSFIGGGGLGKIALSYGYYRYQTNIMIVCVVLLVLMVQVFQTVGTFWATRSDKRLRK